MAINDDVTSLNFLEIVARCREETDRFRKHLEQDPRFCFELLTRAFHDFGDEQLKAVYQIYLPILSARARRHPLFPQSSQDHESFARLALIRFYGSCRKSSFAQKFSNLSSAMAYLYTCLHSAIAQDVRENLPMLTLDEELWASDTDLSTSADLDSRDVWAHITRLLPEEVDQRLVHMRFVLAMTPAEIVRCDPQQWHDERSVSVALQRIRRRLRGDADLRELAGID